MKDIVDKMDDAVIREQTLLLDIKKKYALIEFQLQDVQERTSSYRTESKWIIDKTHDAEYQDFIELKLRVISEYYRRILNLAEAFKSVFPGLFQLTKQIRIQVVMLRSQLKFKIETLGDQSLLNVFSGNVQAVVKLIQVLSERMAHYETQIMVASELNSHIMNIFEDVEQRFTAIKNSIKD